MIYTIYPQSLFITWMVYLDLTWRPAPGWLVSSVGRALHWYRRGHGVQIPYGPEFSSVHSCQDLLYLSPWVCIPFFGNYDISIFYLSTFATLLYSRSRSFWTTIPLFFPVTVTEILRRQKPLLCASDCRCFSLTQSSVH